MKIIVYISRGEGQKKGEKKPSENTDGFLNLDRKSQNYLDIFLSNVDSPESEWEPAPAVRSCA